MGSWNKPFLRFISTLVNLVRKKGTSVLVRLVMRTPDDMCNVSTGPCVPAGEHTDTHQQACLEDSSVFMVMIFIIAPTGNTPLLLKKWRKQISVYFFNRNSVLKLG